MSEPLLPITKKQAYLFACFFVLYEFLTYLANDMIMPGMIDVVKTFNAPETMVATSLTFYVVGGASLQIILGPISDSYGRRPMMLMGACLFFLFSLLIACSFSMNQFLAARFFQGMGLCFIGVIGYATVQELFEEMDAVRLIAIMANVAILAPLLGPLLGAIVLHYASWRIIFVVIAFCALFSLWGLWQYMPEPIGSVKKDGQIIPKIPLSFKEVFRNYKELFLNPTFCLTIVALGLLGIPCLVWIALAPVILIADAHLTVFQYGLWQLPVFGATILGNWALHRLTYNYSLKTIVAQGCVLLVIGVALIALLPYFFGNNYLYLMPGIIIYFFALSVINGPLNRFCLFATKVSKGTASAVLSLSVMLIEALGIEVANIFYSNHVNLNLGIYCNVVELLFLICTGLAFIFGKEPQD